MNEDDGPKSRPISFDVSVHAVATTSASRHLMEKSPCWLSWGSTGASEAGYDEEVWPQHYRNDCTHAPEDYRRLTECRIKEAWKYIGRSVGLRGSSPGIISPKVGPHHMAAAREISGTDGAVRDQEPFIFPPPEFTVTFGVVQTTGFKIAANVRYTGRCCYERNRGQFKAIAYYRAVADFDGGGEPVTWKQIKIAHQSSVGNSRNKHPKFLEFPDTGLKIEKTSHVSDTTHG